MINIGTRTCLAKTCLTCGVLKMASEFGRVKKRYLNSYCNSCRNRDYVYPFTAEAQQKALSTATKHREPWSEGDFTKLEEMLAEGRTTSQMALVLNRSVYSVNNMRFKIKETV